MGTKLSGENRPHRAGIWSGRCCQHEGQKGLDEETGVGGYSGGCLPWAWRSFAVLGLFR